MKPDYNNPLLSITVITFSAFYCGLKDNRNLPIELLSPLPSDDESLEAIFVILAFLFLSHRFKLGYLKPDPD
jgi:hypothetical protein